MGTILAFDIYGTLIDTAGVVVELEKQVGKIAPVVSQLWREKQLEYSFRRGLMQNYQDFSVCTRDALDYVCRSFQLDIDDTQKNALLDSYRCLPSFADVKDGLEQLKSSEFRLFAFSNGRAEDVDALLSNANIQDYFEDIISVDEIKSFKPNPAVYSHFLRRASAIGIEALLISSNPFDVIGAISAGMRAAWVQRSTEAIFDPWGIEPTLTVTRLTELKQAIEAK